MSGQEDWTPVVIKKTATKPTSERDIAAAKAKGEVESVRKVAHTAPTNAKKLDDNESDDFKHQTVTHEFKVALQKARQAKGLSQKDLAQKLNVKPSIIQDYENGKAIPNGSIISQLNRTLGVTLPKIPKKKATSSSSSASDD